MKKNYRSKNLLRSGLIITATLLSSLNILKAQEAAENPLDTLTRFVHNISDEVNKAKRLSITGYIQPQFQIIDSAGAPSVAGGDFVNGKSNYSNRFMMRRGRFKFTYEYENAVMVINTDATEKGLNMRETYVKVTDPWLKMFSLTAGLLQYQFGFEITQSSGIRETPERARYNQTLFPVERDLGLFGRMAFPKSSGLFGLSLDLAVMNGAAGVTPEFDSYKDYTGRLAYGRTLKGDNTAFNIGVSAYHGGYKTGSVKDYNFNPTYNTFVLSTDADPERKAKRQYVSVDAQIAVDWAPGLTTLRGEYIQGQQPGTTESTKSPGTLQVTDLFHRNFNGAYFYFIQNLGQSPLQLVVKYDFYDPNMQVAGTDIGKKGTNTQKADIRFDTYGFGANYRVSSNVKLMVYYDYVVNEATSIKGYTQDIQDNVTTVRLQFKF